MLAAATTVIGHQLNIILSDAIDYAASWEFRSLENKMTNWRATRVVCVAPYVQRCIDDNDKTHLTASNTREWWKQNNRKVMEEWIDTFWLISHFRNQKEKLLAIFRESKRKLGISSLSIILTVIFSISTFAVCIICKNDEQIHPVIKHTTRY